MQGVEVPGVGAFAVSDVSVPRMDFNREAFGCSGASPDEMTVGGWVAHGRFAR